MGMGVFCDLKVKSWIINKYDNIRFILQYVSFAKRNIAQYRRQMRHHLDKTHKSQITNVAHLNHFWTLEHTHLVTTPKTYIRIMVTM